jgi:hypothetical protein
MGANAAFFLRRSRRVSERFRCTYWVNELSSIRLMNSRSLRRLESRGLGVSQSWFGAAFGESPVSAVGPNQQEFDATAANPIADGGDLFASPQLAKLRQVKEPGRWLMRPGEGHAAGRRCSIIHSIMTHSSRVPDAATYC